MFAAELELSPAAKAIRDKLAESEAGLALRSASGNTVISGVALSSADKLSLLQFTDDIRAGMSGLLSHPFDHARHALHIRLAEGRTNDVCEIRLLPRRDFDPPLQVHISKPEKLEGAYLAVELCKALLMADARSPELPGWFASGVARLLPSERRQDDFEAVLERWSRAELPPASELLAPFSPYASAEPALAAQLVAWLLDSPERAFYVNLREHLASGGAWSADFALSKAGAPREAGLADAAWDRWLLARRWVVLSAGRTPAGLVARTRPQLCVRPGTLGVYFANMDAAPLEPGELIALRKEPWIPTALAAKLAFLQRVAAGRGDEYRTAIEAYSEFFRTLWRGGSERALRRLLERADELLLAIEE